MARVAKSSSVKAAKSTKQETKQVAEEVKQVTSEPIQTKIIDLTHAEKLLNSDPAKLVIKLSHTLKSRLIFKAQSEGLSVSEFCEELLAEGAVLRAWEIMERKATLKQEGGNRSPNYQNQNHGNGNQRNNHNHQNNRRHQHMRQNKQNNFNNRMNEDNAQFIDYVRKQTPT